MQHFASDNYAPVHPEVMAALTAANGGPDVPYGDDATTDRLQARTRELFGPKAAVFPVLIGTGANVISLMAAAPRWGGVVLSDVAHANTDENGAPERVGGLKLLVCPSTHGRITTEAVRSWSRDLGNPHRAQPAVLSLTQSTELGTVYSLQELRSLTEAAHDLGMLVHVDGSRLANAAASLGTGLRELTTDAGVDILSLGAAKNGGMIGEAVVVLDGGADAGLVETIPYLRKQTMQLASKARFVSAQLLALLGEPDGAGSQRTAAGAAGVPGPGATPGAASPSGREPLWLRNARHANAMAARLRAAVERTLPGDVVRVTHPTEANVVFASLPRRAADAVRARFRFYDWADGETPDRVEARWMCSWATTEPEVDAFVEAIAAAVD
ncbi:threonine aldolase family protein [Myceligenerans salitolerans]|uniref:Threonine aldolase n=1 Tax=Myceligenerans salitolerans TaxID=1230528 RepID=A0ABS3I8Y7_9MICO|nr:beta-eliminating lyase-related protein [Myceligenerans salitolerans]MBO0609490.1 threonine aldolase [Myceligenerans salitolerans]